MGKHEFLNSPEAVDRAEKKRVKELKKKAQARPHLDIASNEKDRNGKPNTIVLGYRDYQLGITDSISAGDIAMRKLKYREYVKAQHGPVRVLFKDGKPVKPDFGPKPAL